MLTSKTVVLNTPTSIDTLQLFKELKVRTKQKVTPVHYHHLIFIIHQLNYYTKKYGFCDFDSQAYYQTLGCAPNIVASILLVLDDNKLIKRTRRGNNINEKVSSYVYLNTFDFKDEVESDSHIYTVGEKGTPKFINRWVSNNWKMERSDDVVKVKKSPTMKSLTKKQLQLQNEQLMAEIASLRAQISNSNISIVEDIIAPVIASNEVFVAAKPDNEFNKNTPDFTMCEAHSGIENELEDEESLKDVYTLTLKTKTYYFMNYTVILNAVKDEDDESILINKLQDAKDGDGQSLLFNEKFIKFNKVGIENEIMIQLVA